MNESAFLDAHRKAIAELGLHSPEPAPAPHYQISTLKPGQGRGFVDLYDFGRVILGCGDYVLSAAQIIESRMPLHFFGTIFCLPAGVVRKSKAKTRRAIDIAIQLGNLRPRFQKTGKTNVASRLAGFP